MVKKFLSVFAIASMMLATSCSNDEFDSLQTGNEATVSFTAQLPDGLQTKSRAVYGDGETATTLSYAVYEVTKDGWTLREDLGKTDEEIHMTKTVSLRLVNGNEYAVVFWADAPSSIYDFDTENIKVTADYTKNSGVKSNDEKLDAFFAVETIIVNGAASKDVKLQRPFAQLNIGTADLAAAKAAGHEVNQAGIKVKTYNTLNFKDGSVRGETDVTFALADLPKTPEKFPVDGYDYLTMNYLLMPTDKKADNAITIIYDNAQERTFQNVPLQRNYRTNIYGNLLTSQNDFNVEIKPGFDGDYNESVWDGTSIDEPKLVDGTYQITKASEWIWIVKNGVGTNNISLTGDIDFGGKEIGSVALLGTFDGNGYMMSNMAYVNNGKEAAAGMFSVPNVAGTEVVTIKNVTIKGAKIDSYYVDQLNTFGYAGVVIGCLLSGQDVTLDNVIVENADVKGIQGVSGLVGIVSGSTLTVKNSLVKNSDIKNYSVEKESGYVATLVGKCSGTVNFENVASLNNKLVGIYAGESNKRPEASIDEIAALRSGTIVGTENATKANNQIIKVPYGALVISTVEELKEFADAVNNGNNFGGKTVVLASDIDLAGYHWTPIGQSSNGNDFNGIFDGNGCTIKNLTITDNATEKYHATGFFGWSFRSQIKNINFENANVSGHNYTGVVVGYIEFATIQNCTVNNSDVKTSFAVDEVADGKKCGGILGMASATGCTVKDCHVSNTSVDAEKDAGCVIGCAYSSIVSVNNTFENVTIVNEDSSKNKNTAVIGRYIQL